MKRALSYSIFCKDVIKNWFINRLVQLFPLIAPKFIFFNLIKAIEVNVKKMFH